MESEEASLRDRVVAYLERVGTVGDPDALNLLRETAEFLKNSATTLRTQTSPEVTAALTSIQAALSSISARIPPVIVPAPTQKPATAASTYAAAAARPATSSVPSRVSKPVAKTSPTPKQSRRAKELLLRVTDASDREKIKAKSSEELAKSLENIQQVKGISRMPNGDLRIYAASEDAKKALEENSSWTKVVAASAAVSRRTFAVKVNGVRVGSFRARQEDTIARITQANARLHPGLRIMKASWTAKAIRMEKTHSKLHVEVATAEMANRIILEGFLVDYEVKHCERFTKGANITQCFNCQMDGHIALDPASGQPPAGDARKRTLPTTVWPPRRSRLRGMRPARPRGVVNAVPQESPGEEQGGAKDEQTCPPIRSAAGRTAGGDPPAPSRNLPPTSHPGPLPLSSY